MESIEQTFNGSADFGRKVTCTISRNGDLIHRVYLRAILPEVSNAGANERWVDWVGEALIKTCEVEIGGQRIDRHYGDWLHIWNELTQTAGHQAGYEAMVGQVDALHERNSDNKLPRYTLYVPLQFWFCRNPGLALPLIALQYHEVKVNLEFRDKKDLFQGDLSKVGGLVSASLYVDYIYLDTDERRRFAQVSHEYLIEQLQFTGDESVNSVAPKVKLNLNHPVKELVWVVQSDRVLDGSDEDVAGAYTGPQWFNYTDGVKSNSLDVGGANPVETAKLQLNGHDRFSDREGMYFSVVQPYQHHENVPASGAINVYSFGLKPEEHQPSGTCNMSRIDTASLNLTLSNKVFKGKNSAGAEVQVGAKVRIYATNYNVLRIMSGKPPHAAKSYMQHNSWNHCVGKSFGHPRRSLHRMPVASRSTRPARYLDVRETPKATSTKVASEKNNWPRIMNLGMVKMMWMNAPCVHKMGNPQAYHLNSLRQEYGEVSETERVSVVNDGLVIQRRLKIQSGPLGNQGGFADGRLGLQQLIGLNRAKCMWSRKTHKRIKRFESNTFFC
jgi:hypothetical protein